MKIVWVIAARSPNRGYLTADRTFKRDINDPDVSVFARKRDADAEIERDGIEGWAVACDC